MERSRGVHQKFLSGDFRCLEGHPRTQKRDVDRQDQTGQVCICVVISQPRSAALLRNDSDDMEASTVVTQSAMGRILFEVHKPGQLYII